MKSLERISAEIDAKATLVAVSKTKPLSGILELYEQGQRDFGENYVQELIEKHQEAPADIRWHFIGHLQSNKVRQIAPFVHLIHAVDSLKLLKEIEKEAARNNRTIDVLVQLHIAQEETKHGLDHTELTALTEYYNSDRKAFAHVRVCGLMGMASFTDDTAQVRYEFRQLKEAFDLLKHRFFAQEDSFSVLSMGMSGDYRIALEEGSTILRIGSLLFGAR